MAGSGGLVGFLKSMMPDLGLALRRFPITIAIAAIFTALHLAGMSDLLGLRGDQSLRLSLALISAFLFAFATGLLVKQKILDRQRSSGLAPLELPSLPLSSFFNQYLFCSPFSSFSRSYCASAWRPIWARGARPLMPHSGNSITACGWAPDWRSLARCFFQVAFRRSLKRSSAF